MAKRRRITTTNVVRAPRRPIDKHLKCITITNMGSTQRNSVLLTATFPGTVVGLRWTMTFYSPLTTGPETIYWVICVVPDGVTASTIATSDTAKMYAPEQHVLAYGVEFLGDFDTGLNPSRSTAVGATKSMRKLKAGDVLSFQVLGLSGTVGTCRGVVQFFLKT